MEKSNFFIRISKTLRKMLYFAFPFFAILLAWKSNFDYVKNILLRVLSEDTVHIFRLILQYSLGTQSVAMSLQLLISYSFIFISVSSCTLFIVNMVRLMMLIVYREGVVEDKDNHERAGNTLTLENNRVYLTFSRLNI